jgi:hypothetical protein
LPVERDGHQGVSSTGETTGDAQGLADLQTEFARGLPISATAGVIKAGFGLGKMGQATEASLPQVVDLRITVLVGAIDLLHAFVDGLQN